MGLKPSFPTLGNPPLNVFFLRGILGHPGVFLGHPYRLGRDSSYNFKMHMETEGFWGLGAPGGSLGEC